MQLTSLLGAPLALAELGWMSTYIVDAIMVGRMPHSALAISASSLGNSIFYAILFTAVGLLYGLDTLVSQAFGRGDLKDCYYSLAQSLTLVVASTPVIMVLTLLSPYMLTWFGVSAEIVSETTKYIHALVWSTAPLLLYMAVRRYLQAIDRPLWVMVSLLTANLVNLVGDWILIYGHFGFRPMGIAGSGWATVYVRIYMLLLLFIGLVLSSRGERWNFSLSLLAPSWARIRMLLKLGWPVGIQSLAELGVATVITILAGKLGATLLAAHQVVLDLNAFVYMVPLGLSAATAVRVGQGTGRWDVKQVRRAELAGVALGAGFMCIAGASFVSVPRVWANIYTTDRLVVAATIPVFLLCAGNQIFSGALVILTGALRGLGNTRTAMFASLGWYWLFGVPLSALLCFVFHMGLVGLWLGGSLAAIGITLQLLVAWHRGFKRLQAVAGRGQAGYLNQRTLDAGPDFPGAGQVSE